MQATMESSYKRAAPVAGMKKQDKTRQSQDKQSQAKTTQDKTKQELNNYKAIRTQDITSKR